MVNCGGRFDYSKRFLSWALQPPGWKKAWHCGIRVCSNRKLVGFISAVPAHIRIKDQSVGVACWGVVLIGAHLQSAVDGGDQLPVCAQEAQVQEGGPRPHQGDNEEGQ